MSSLLQLLKEFDAGLPEPPVTSYSPKLRIPDRIVKLTGIEALQCIIRGESVLISRRKLREIIAALESR